MCVLKPAADLRGLSAGALAAHRRYIRSENSAAVFLNAVEIGRRNVGEKTCMSRLCERVTLLELCERVTLPGLCERVTLLGLCRITFA